MFITRMFFTRMIRRHDESGMTTSEYAVGTLGAATIGSSLLLLVPTAFDLYKLFLRDAFLPFLDTLGGVTPGLW